MLWGIYLKVICASFPLIPATCHGREPAKKKLRISYLIASKQGPDVYRPQDIPNVSSSRKLPLARISVAVLDWAGYLYQADVPLPLL